MFMFYVLCLVYFLFFLLCTVVGMRGKGNFGPLYVCTYIGLTIKLSDSDSDFLIQDKAYTYIAVYNIIEEFHSYKDTLLVIKSHM